MRNPKMHSASTAHASQPTHRDTSNTISQRPSLLPSTTAFRPLPTAVVVRRWELFAAHVFQAEINRMNAAVVTAAAEADDPFVFVGEL
jgi:hypothetical protein